LSANARSGRRTRAIAFILLAALSGVALGGSGLAQGTLVFANFANNTNAVFRAPIYLAESFGFIERRGNSWSGIPTGATAYASGLLQGDGFVAELWGGPAGTSPSLFTPIAGARQTFLAGADAGLFAAPNPVVVPFAAAGTRASFQLRVWALSGGMASHWPSAYCYTVWGQSEVMLSDPLGTPEQPAYLRQLRSFNLVNSSASHSPDRVLALVGDRPVSYFEESSSMTVVDVLAGETVSLRVRCPGNPTSTARWLRDGAELGAEPDGTLVLSTVQEAEAGTYTGATGQSPNGVPEMLPLRVNVWPAPRLSQPRLTPAGAFTAMLDCPIPRTVVLESSSDLRSWTPWSTNEFFVTRPITYPRPVPSGHGFFRARTQP
jgi:hypothetical protein